MKSVSSVFWGGFCLFYNSFECTHNVPHTMATANGNMAKVFRIFYFFILPVATVEHT